MLDCFVKITFLPIILGDATSLGAKATLASEKRSSLLDGISSNIEAEL